MQKKLSLRSKHEASAKEEWSLLQEKLKNNIFDSSTSKVLKTALESKNLHLIKAKYLTQTQKTLAIRKEGDLLNEDGKRGKKEGEGRKEDEGWLMEEERRKGMREGGGSKEEGRKKEGGMRGRGTAGERMRDEVGKRQKGSGGMEGGKEEGLLGKIEKNIEKTRMFIRTMEGCKDPEKVIRRLERNEGEKENERNWINQEHEGDEWEMSNYFKSLDKIEETIHFLERNLNSGDREAQTLYFQKENEAEDWEEEGGGRDERERKEMGEMEEGRSRKEKKNEETRRREEGERNGVRRNEEGEKEEEIEKKEQEKEESPFFFKESVFSHTNEFLENSLQPASFQVTPEKDHMDSGNMIQIKRLFFDQEETRKEEVGVGGGMEEERRRKEEGRRENKGKQEGGREEGRNEREEEEGRKKVIYCEVAGENLRNHLDLEDDEEEMLSKIKSMLLTTKNDLSKLNTINYDFPNFGIIGQKGENGRRREQEERGWEHEERKSEEKNEMGIGEKRREGLHKWNLDEKEENFCKGMEREEGRMMGRGTRNADEGNEEEPRSYNVQQYDDRKEVVLNINKKYVDSNKMLKLCNLR